jgi:hypothetical protein
MLGMSGQIFANVVLNFLPEQFTASLALVRVACNRETNDVNFTDSFDPPTVATRPILLIDSSIHSGRTMLAVSQKLSSLGISDIITYAIVFKKSSALIPNYFGVLLEQTDRCLFQLETIPNNRLCKRAPFGVLRALSETDVHRPFPVINEPSVETTFATLLYERENYGSNVFVYEHKNAICGVLSFIKKGKSLFIDLVANSTEYRGCGIGAAMIRWAETWARSADCEAIELWAIENQVDFYKSRQFIELDRWLDLGTAKFKLMRRRLLYNTSMIGSAN